MDHYPERERLSQPSQDSHIYLSEDGRLYFSPTDPQNSSSSTPQQNLQSSVFPSEDLLNPEIYSARKVRDRWAGWVMIGCSLLLLLGFLDIVFMMLDEHNQEISSILVMIRTATDCFMIFTAWIGSRAAKQLNSQSTRTFYKAMVICGVLCVGSFCLIMIESSSRDKLNPNDGRRLYEAGRYQGLYDHFESSYNTQLDRIDTDKQQEYPVDCDEDNCQDAEISAGISREWVKAAEKYFTLYEQQIKDLSLDTFVSWDMDEIEDLRDFIRENGQDIEAMFRSYEGKWNYLEDEYSYEETEIDINSEGRKLQAYSSKQWDWKDDDDHQDKGDKGGKVEEEEDKGEEINNGEEDKGGRRLEGYSAYKWDWSDTDEDEDEYGNREGRKVKEYWHSDWLFKIKEFTDKDEYKHSDFEVTMSEEHPSSSWKDEDENTYEYKYSNTYLNTDNAGRSLQDYSTSDSSDYDDTDDNDEYIYTETQIDTEDYRGLQRTTTQT